MNIKNLTTIPSILARCCRKFSKKPALVLPNGNKISYSDMMWDISRTTQLLKEQGIRKHNKIVLFIDETPSSLETFLAITRLGAVAVVLQYDFTKEQIKNIFEFEKPEITFINEEELGLIPQEAHDYSLLFGMQDNKLLSKNTERKLSVCNYTNAVADSDLAVVGFVVEADKTLTRTEFSQKLIAQTITTFKKNRKAKKEQKQNPLNSLVSYAKNLICPVLKGISVCCNGVTRVAKIGVSHNFSEKK